MSILVLNFSPHERLPYEELLAPLNEKLVLITSVETAPSFPKEAFEHIEIIENYVNNPLVYHRAIQLHRKYSFHKVVAAFEADILMAAKLRAYFNIDGQSVNSAINYRDKVIMKEKISASGLRVPKFKRIFDVVDLHAFIDEIGFPFVIKPADGFGSIGTTIIRSEAELDAFILGNPSLYNLVVEEFINGRLHTVDGIIKQGEIAFISVTEAIGGNFIDMDQNGISGSMQLDPTNPIAKRMIKYCEDVIQALETPSNTAFHAEIFHTNDDDIVICEIASRPAGAHIAPCAKHSYGIDMTQVHVQIQTDVPTNIPNNGKGYSPEKLCAWVYFNLEEGKLLSLPNEQPPYWVFEYKISGKVGQVYSKDSYVLKRLAHILIEARSEEELKDRVQTICNWFTSQTSWDVQ